MGKNKSGQVSRRRVFYIPGYDPIHPRRYRELYRKEGASQADISGYDLALTPGKSGGNYGWHVTAQIDGVQSDADVEVLVWSDIVRDSMENSIPATYVQLARTAWVYIASGTLWRLMKLRKGPVIAALYPIGMLLSQLLIAVLVGVLVYSGFAALMSPYLGILGIGLSLIVGCGVMIWLLTWFKRKDAKFFAYYA